MKRDSKLYGTLFLQTLKLSAFTFGGGYVIISLMKKQFVDKLGWMNEKEMLDYTAIAQSSPGAIAVNAAILVGYNLGGVLGALVAIVGTVLPPLVILTAISYVYSAFMSITAIQYIMLGMQAGVVAVICDVVWGLTQSIWKENRYVAVVVALLAFGATAIFSVNVMLVVVLCALFGCGHVWKGREEVIVLELFWAFFQIGLFSVGGGYAAMPLIQEQVIDKFHWMTVSEFTDLITISQMTPGPIAINSASFIGARMAGIPGALIATVGCVLPSCVIVSVIALLYKRYSSLTLIDGVLKGIRPAVVGMIASAALTMMQASWFADTLASVGGVDVAAVLIFAAAFFVLRKWKPSPILVMSAAGGCGLLVYGLLDLLGKG